jgi:hypothetical protein
LPEKSIASDWQRWSMVRAGGTVWESARAMLC